MICIVAIVTRSKFRSECCQEEQNHLQVVYMPAKAPPPIASDQLTSMIARMACLSEGYAGSNELVLEIK